MKKRIMYNVAQMKAEAAVSCLMIATLAWAAQSAALSLPSVMVGTSLDVPAILFR